MNTASSAVLFDLDGTLLDTELLYSTAAERVCSRYGALYTLSLKRRTMGGDTLSGAQLVVHELKLPITPREFIDQREHELMQLLPSLSPMPGAEALVSELAQAGIAMAIATSGHRHITEQKLAIQPFLSRISALICGDDPRLLHPKPAPDIYLLAARELGRVPRNCVVIEDSLNGVRAGIAAGMQTVALLDARWGFDPDQFTGAARIVSSLEQLSPASLLGLGRSVPQ